MDYLLYTHKPEFLAIYGRRRVGKTFLVQQHLKKYIVFDFTGKKEGSLHEQLANFYDELVKRSSSFKRRPSPTSWQIAFAYLAEYLRKLPKTKEKHVVFIDEMPWLDSPRSKFVSSLEYFWNQFVSNMEDVLLIACGSASSWIKKNLIEARGGLYNRITKRIKLYPFTLYETEQYLKSMGIKLSGFQIVELYMTMGGIPFYLNEVSKGKSVSQLIDQICFTKNGLLYNEYAQLYYALFRNAEHHVKVIETLSKHPQGLIRNDLASKTKLAEGSLSRVLEELVECDFVSSIEPLFNKRKTTIYKITDFYSLFYMKFIKPNKNSGKGTWNSLSQKNNYVAWTGYAYENICLQHIEQIKAALGISGIYSRIGSWFFKGNNEMPGCQIDMLIDRDDQVINLCEAKFSKGNFILNKNYRDQLRLKESIFLNNTESKKSIHFTLITSFPAVQNKYYFEQVYKEINLDNLFSNVK